MKKIPFLLALLLLLQSCNVYNKPTSLEAAVVADEKVKVITTNDQKYIFKRLVYENDRLIGIAKRGSVTATKLAGMPAETDGKFTRFDISNVEIDEIILRNESSSTVLTVVTVAASLVVAFYAILFIALSSGGFMENY